MKKNTENLQNKSIVELIATILERDNTILELRRELLELSKKLELFKAELARLKNSQPSHK